MNIVCINEDIPRFQDKYKFIDQVFEFNKKSNPQAAFHYISNNTKAINGVNIHCISDYEDDNSRMLEKNFLSLSSVPSELELAWIKRWLILHNFMQSGVRPPILYLDNDVLLFTCILDWPEEIKKADYSLSENTSPHTNWISNTSVLQEFSKYILSIYIDRESEFLKFESIYKKMQAKGAPGGVGDMMLWTHFSRQELFPSAIKDISQVFNKTESFDHNIHTTNNIWEKEGKYKKINFRHGAPYCHNLEHQRAIKLNTLHFQGGAKSKMVDILNDKL